MQRGSLQYESLLQHYLRFPLHLVRMSLQLDKLLFELRNCGLQSRVARGHALSAPAALLIKWLRRSRPL